MSEGTKELEAVPIIHLPLNHGSGKASLEEYLKMIPKHLLRSETKIIPVSVRKIEHEDFIDYEIEFLEVSEEEESDSDSGEDVNLVRRKNVINKDRRKTSSDVFT